MRPLALTGIPGTGKSTVARRLVPALRCAEVGELALHFGTGTSARRPGGLVVDLEATRRAWRRLGASTPDVVVGHLAHLLPIRDVVVLRCHPRILARRLSADPGRRPRDTRENLLAEATDVVLVEAVQHGRRIWEIDTTDRSPDQVAREVFERWQRRGAPSYGRVDWLADRWVTEHLLDWSR